MTIKKLKKVTKFSVLVAIVVIAALSFAELPANAAGSAQDCYGTSTNVKSDSGDSCIDGSFDPANCPYVPAAQQKANKCTPAQIETDTDTVLIKKYLNPFIKLLSVMVGLAVTFGIIYGAIQYSMSAGDPQKAQNGKNHIKNAVIALVAYALIFAFLNFIIPGGIN